MTSFADFYSIETGDQCIVDYTIPFCIFSIVCLFVGIYIFYHGFKAISSKSTNMLSFFKIMFFISSIGFILYSILFTINAFILCFSTNIAMWTVWILETCLYFVILLPSLLITLTARLHFSFHASIYRVNKYILYAVCILVGTFLILNCCFVILHIWITYFNGYVSVVVLGFIIVLSTSIYLILSVILVSLFILNLKALVFAQTVSTRSINADIQLSRQQKKWIAQSSKYAVISTLAFLSSFLHFALVCVFVMQNHYEVNLIDLRIVIITNALDSTINTCCLYLHFAFANNDYNRCCSVCDRCCRQFLQTKTANKLNSIRLQKLNTEETGKEYMVDEV